MADRLKESDYKEITDNFKTSSYEEILKRSILGDDTVKGSYANLTSGSLGGRKGVLIGKDGFVSTTIRAYLASDATITAGGARKILFDTESFDALGEFDPDTNHRFTVVRAGYYLINSIVDVDTNTDQTFFELMIYKNGSAYSNKKHQSSTANAVSLQITDLLYLIPGDYIEIFIDSAEVADYTAKGGAGLTFLNIHRVY